MSASTGFLAAVAASAVDARALPLCSAAMNEAMMPGLPATPAAARARATSSSEMPPPASDDGVAGRT